MRHDLEVWRKLEPEHDGHRLIQRPSITAIFTPGSEGRSFQTSSDGSSMMCSACWAAWLAS